MQNNFKGLIFTNHALQRLKDRNIKQGDAWATWNRPDKSRFAKNKGAWRYLRTWDNTQIEVVAKKNEKNEWIVLSVWSKKVVPKKAKKSIWKRIFGIIE
ncbi:DUF4258 domain-containing protein [Candidatus Microgenomates bacterium]|nr:DUF4258 domain-containing protein [Candidatus Microgenomates bacterium]